MTTPDQQPRPDGPESPLGMSEEQLAKELRAAIEAEPDPQSRRRLERIADEVLASLRSSGTIGTKNGNTAA